MPAVVVHGAGDLRLEEVEDRRVGPGEVEVRVRYGGICGSDVHYAEHGLAGRSVIREPLILGHELAGVIAEVGQGVEGLAEGQRVTVHPVTPCGGCYGCTAGRPDGCVRPGYLGSAADLPHVQGGFRERLVVDRRQVVPIPDELPLLRAALAEPLAVALHAVGRLGEVEGSTVLVVGAGPIGLLVVAALRSRGAGSVIVSDVAPAPLEIAGSMGADVVELGRTGVASRPVDGAIECSGTPGGLESALGSTKRGGRVVEVGLSPIDTSPVELNLLVTREIELVGAFRFEQEILDAVQLLAAGLEVEPMVAATVPIDQAARAFAFAADRDLAGKVILEV